MDLFNPPIEFNYKNIMKEVNFESFENWVIAHAGGQIDEETVKLCNALFEIDVIVGENINSNSVNV